MQLLQHTSLHLKTCFVKVRTATVDINVARQYCTDLSNLSNKIFTKGQTINPY